MTDHSVRVGDAEITSVTDGHIHFKPSDFFPKVEPEEWVRYADQLNEHGMIKMNVGSFVVRVGGSTALIDTVSERETTPSRTPSGVFLPRTWIARELAETRSTRSSSRIFTSITSAGTP